MDILFLCNVSFAYGEIKLQKLIAEMLMSGMSAFIAIANIVSWGNFGFIFYFGQAIGFGPGRVLVVLF